MCAPASLNEWIRCFFLYLLQLLRSGSVCSSVGGGQWPAPTIFGPQYWWVVASVWPSMLYSRVYLLNPACSQPPSYPVPILTFRASRYSWGQRQPEPENDTGVSIQQSVHVNTCEHMCNRAAQKQAGTATHSPAFTAAPFENTPVISCSTLHFVLPPRTRRNVSVNSGDTL